MANMTYRSFPVPDFVFVEYVHYILIAISKEATSDGMLSNIQYSNKWNICSGKICVEILGKICVQVKYMFK